MALINHPSLYYGGTVVFDQQPHTALYAQALARRQARDEAFDEYIRGLNKGVNSAGVRNADRPAFDKMYQDWQKFGIENRDAIRNRKGGADIRFMQMYQDLNNLASESKTTEEGKKPVIELMLDPNKRDRLHNDDFVNMIASHDKPLYVQGPDGTLQRNPEFKSIDLSKIEFDPKPFEQDKYFKQYEDIKRTDLPPEIVKNPKDMTQTVTTTSTFDNDAKNAIATRAVTDYANNPAFRSMVKGLKKDDYNTFFRANYGRDIENDGDLAAAYTLKGMQQSVKTSKLEPDTYGRQVALENIRDAHARQRAAIQQGYRRSLVDYRRAGTKKDQESVLEGYIQRAFDEGKEGRSAVYVKGQAVPARQIAVPVEITKKYTKGTPGKADEEVPVKFMMTEDKKYVVPIYPGKSSKGETNHIPIEQFRNDLGKIWLTKKDATAEMADDLDFGEDEEDGSEGVFIESPTAAPQDDSYTRQELKSAGWTDEKINTAVKAGKIKVK